MRRAVTEGLLVKGGGHAMAAGVTLAKDRLGQLSLSIDGEAVTGESAVTLRKRPDQLLVYRPHA